MCSGESTEVTNARSSASRVLSHHFYFACCVLQVFSWRSRTLCTPTRPRLSFLHIRRARAPPMFIAAQPDRIQAPTRRVKHSALMNPLHLSLLSLALCCTVMIYCNLHCLFSLVTHSVHIKVGPGNFYNSLPLLPEHQCALPMETVQHRASRGGFISG